jgi:hypothetical protein
MADDELKLEVETGKVLATFLGDAEASRSACDALVAELERGGPRRVQIMCDFASPTSWPAAVAGKRLASVTAVIFDTFFQTQTRQRGNAIGDLRAMFDAFPSLRQLFATGMLALTAVEHATLRELHLLGDPLSPALFAGLGASKLPALDKLALSLASDAGPGAIEPVLAALATLHAPALREVYVEGFDSVEHALAKLADAGLGASWRELTLCGQIDDEDQLLETLETHAGALRSLGTLGLPLADYVSTDAADRARALVPAITDSDEIESPTLPAAYARWPN